MKEFTTYNDIMPFFTLLPKGYFGGRVLLPEARRKLTKDEQEHEK